MTDTPTPSSGFEFPQDARDVIENSLRSLNAPKNEPIRSVRPERQKKMVVPTQMDDQEEAPMKVATQQSVKAMLPNMVKATLPEPTPISTADYVSIDLPSNFVYYPFKDLYIKPFRIPHLAKLAKADARSSMQLIAEVVSSVLITPEGHQDIAFKLSIADLNAVMFWLRMNSFTQASMGVITSCDNETHIAAVREGKKPEESLKIHTTITATDVEIVYLENVPDPEHYCIRFPEDGDKVLHMRPETVTDSIQFLDHPDWTDEEVQYKVKIASVLDFESFMPEIDWTLAQKMEFVDDVLTVEQAMLAIEFSDLVDSFGVVETFKTKCMGCGASGTGRLSFDARSFLSPSF